MQVHVRATADAHKVKAGRGVIGNLTPTPPVSQFPIFEMGMIILPPPSLMAVVLTDICKHFEML